MTSIEKCLLLFEGLGDILNQSQKEVLNTHENIKNTVDKNEDKYTVVNNNHITINGGVVIKDLTINITVNDGALNAKSSFGSSGIDRLVSSSEDYWIERDKSYRKSLEKFYRANG